jgi:hypothetical protein
MDFTHNAYEVLYDEPMKSFKVCDALGEDRSCSNGFNPEYSFPDHDMYWIRIDNSIC